MVLIYMLHEDFLFRGSFRSPSHACNRCNCFFAPFTPRVTVGLKARRPGSHTPFPSSLASGESGLCGPACVCKMGVVGEFKFLTPSFIKNVFRDGIPEASFPVTISPTLIRRPHISGTVFGALGLKVRAGFMPRIHWGVLRVRTGFLGQQGEGVRGARLGREQSRGEPRSASEARTARGSRCPAGRVRREPGLSPR